MKTKILADYQICISVPLTYKVITKHGICFESQYKTDNTCDISAINIYFEQQKEMDIIRSTIFTSYKSATGGIL